MKRKTYYFFTPNKKSYGSQSNTNFDAKKKSVVSEINFPILDTNRAGINFHAMF